MLENADLVENDNKCEIICGAPENEEQREKEVGVEAKDIQESQTEKEVGVEAKDIQESQTEKKIVSGVRKSQESQTEKEVGVEAKDIQESQTEKKIVSGVRKSQESKREKNLVFEVRGRENDDKREEEIGFADPGPNTKKRKIGNSSSSGLKFIKLTETVKPIYKKIQTITPKLFWAKFKDFREEVRRKMASPICE